MKSIIWATLHEKVDTTSDKNNEKDVKPVKKFGTDENKNRSEEKLNILYESNLLSENVIIRTLIPILKCQKQSSEVKFDKNDIVDSHDSCPLLLFVAIKDEIRIFNENGLLKKIKINSLIYDFTVISSRNKNRT